MQMYVLVFLFAFYFRFALVGLLLVCWFRFAATVLVRFVIIPYTPLRLRFGAFHFIWFGFLLVRCGCKVMVFVRSFVRSIHFVMGLGFPHALRFPLMHTLHNYANTNRVTNNLVDSSILFPSPSSNANANSNPTHERTKNILITYIALQPYTSISHGISHSALSPPLPFPHKKTHKRAPNPPKNYHHSHPNQPLPLLTSVVNMFSAQFGGCDSTGVGWGWVVLWFVGRVGYL